MTDLNTLLNSLTVEQARTWAAEQDQYIWVEYNILDPIEFPRSQATVEAVEARFEQLLKPAFPKGTLLYWKKEFGAYGGHSDTIPAYLKTWRSQQVSYATIPGFGPGYVNTSAVIEQHMTARVTRALTEDEVKELGCFLLGKTHFPTRADMEADMKATKARAREFAKREQAAWKQAKVI